MKIKINERILKWVYRFVDLETSSASVNTRIIEYVFTIRKLLLLSPGAILDCGCTARHNILSLLLAELGWNVVGIDRRDFRLKHSNFSFVKGDVRKTGFRDSTFDVVLLVSTLEHIGLSGRYAIAEDDPEGDLKTMGEMQRILKPRGILILTVPYGKEFRIVKPLHRIYDNSRLSRLCEHFSKKETVVYSLTKEGYWECSSESYAENSKENIALLELINAKGE